MTTKIQVSDLSVAQLRRLRRAVSGITAGQFLSRVPTKDIERDLLAYVESISRHDSPSARWMESLRRGQTRRTLAERPISELWTIRRRVEGSSIVFELYNRAETQGGARGKAKFRAIELGTTGGVVQYNNPKPFTFLGDRGFVYVHPFAVHRRPARPAKNYLGRALAYYRSTLLPVAKQRIASAVESRIRNA